MILSTNVVLKMTNKNIKPKILRMGTCSLLTYATVTKKSYTDCKRKQIGKQFGFCFYKICVLK